MILIKNQSLVLSAPIKMTLEGTGTFYEHAKNRIVLYIPADVRKDSAFPFKIGEHVRIKIDGKRLIVEKTH